MSIDVPPASEAIARAAKRTTLSNVGRAALGFVGTIKGMLSVLIRTLYYCVRGRREPGAVAYYMHEIGNKSLFFLTVVMGFIGMIMVYQGGMQTLRILPELSLLGPTFLELLVRDLAASIGGLMLATRVGAGIAAEIGSMVVTEQVDALRMSGSDPIDYLIKPRFIASVIMTTCLIIWSAMIAGLSGMLTAWAVFDLNPNTFLNFSLIDSVDLGTGLTKCVAYGAAIPIVSGQAGLATFGGSAGVGTATTDAVVNSSLVVIMLNLTISATSFSLFG